MQTERSIEIAASPEIVWAVTKDVERWPEWTASVTSVRKLEPGPLVVGSGAEILQPGTPRARWVITDYREPTHFTWATHVRGVTIVGRHLLEPIANGTRVTLGVEASGLMARLFGWRLLPLFKRNLELEAHGLKARAEALVKA